MEFNFTIAPYFASNIIQVGARLLPEGFTGDRREVQECVFRMSSILTEVGENSAKAQGLQKVITSGDRLRNSDHKIYLIGDANDGQRGNGSVLGMLKVGIKHLYLFDSSGNNHEVYANCILDFYVHESKQRMGLGKQLFDHFLQAENMAPQHLAIDKPSPKLLAFLDKHYGLTAIIPQMNNFVVFEGFFDSRNDSALKKAKEQMMAAGISSSSARNFSEGFGSQPAEPDSPRQTDRKSSVNSGASTPTAFGRPPAHRPVSTMGMILQQQAPMQRSAPSPAASLVVEEELASYTPAVSEEPEVSEPEEIVEAVEEPLEQLTLEEVEEVSRQATPTVDPIGTPCKVQAATPTHHMDLKFYHSSLW